MRQFDSKVALVTGAASGSEHTHCASPEERRHHLRDADVQEDSLAKVAGGQRAQRRDRILQAITTRAGGAGRRRNRRGLRRAPAHIGDAVQQRRQHPALRPHTDCRSPTLNRGITVNLHGTFSSAARCRTDRDAGNIVNSVVDRRASRDSRQGAAVLRVEAGIPALKNLAIDYVRTGRAKRTRSVKARSADHDPFPPPGEQRTSKLLEPRALARQCCRAPVARRGRDRDARLGRRRARGDRRRVRVDGGMLSATDAAIARPRTAVPTLAPIEPMPPHNRPIPWVGAGLGLLGDPTRFPTHGALSATPTSSTRSASACSACSRPPYAALLRLRRGRARTSASRPQPAQAPDPRRLFAGRRNGPQPVRRRDVERYVEISRKRCGASSSGSAQWPLRGVRLARCAAPPSSGSPRDRQRGRGTREPRAPDPAFRPYRQRRRVSSVPATFVIAATRYAREAPRCSRHRGIVAEILGAAC